MKKFLSFCLIALSLITPSFADNEADKKVVTSLQYVKDELNKKQDNIPAQTSGTYAVTYGTSTTHNAGEISPRQIKTSLGTNTSDTSLPTVGAVNTEINKKQDKIPAKDTNTVVTYAGTVGVVGEKGIYQDEGTYSAQVDNLVEADAFNAAVKTGLDSEFLCAGNASGGDCWLWSIHNEGNGVNLYDRIANPIEQGSIASATGQPFNSTKRIRTGFIDVSPSTQYTVSESGLAYFMVFQYKPDESYLTGTSSGWKADTYTFTTNASAGKIIIILADGQSEGSAPAVTSSDLDWLQVEPGSAATEHLPYTTLVPDDYTPLEYLESSTSNSSGVISLGVSGDATFDVVAQSSRVKGGSQVLLASTPSGTGGTWFGEAVSSRYWGAGSDAVARTSISPTTKISGTVSFSSTGASGRINGESFNRSISITQGDWCVFNSCNGSFPLAGKLWKLLAYQNDVLVGNYVPAKRNSDNVVGLYDVVSQTFKAPSAGTFTAGPDISNVVYMPQGQ